MRYGMVIDLKKCIGCKACTIACKQYHGMPGDAIYTRVLEYERGSYPLAKIDFFPIQCMHCDIPSCVKACPSGAAYKAENGLVQVDAELCHGCRACIIACPYNVRTCLRHNKPYYKEKEKTPYENLKQHNYTKDTVIKCVFCSDRISEGLEPSCVQTCPATARYFGDLDDQSSEVAKLVLKKHAIRYKKDAGTSPKIYYII